MDLDNEILNRVEEIKDHIASSELEKALKRLIDLVRDYNPQKQDEVILLSMRFYGLEKEILAGAISSEESKRVKNNIGFQMLAFIDSISKEISETEKLANHTIMPLVPLTKKKAIKKRVKKRNPKGIKILSAKKILKEYKSTKFCLRVKQLNFYHGQIVALLGENATGKTTLLRILSGNLSIRKGKLSYPLFQTKGNRLNWAKIKRQIAFVPQELPKWHGSLKENLRYEAAVHGIRGKSVEKEVNYIIHRLGLALHIDKSWKQLSGGFKLRFALAKALVWNPQLLVIDEPLAFLDIKAQWIVLNDLRELAKSSRNPITIILSSQHVHEMEMVADQLLFMKEGELIEINTQKSLGINRNHNVFEFGCYLDLNEIKKRLSNFEYSHIRHTGFHYVIYTSININATQIIDYFQIQEIEFDYFRNISWSLKTKFYETIT